MGSIRRGFGIAVSAVRGWRRNPLLPFVVRGLGGERHRLKFALFVLGLVVVMPLGHQVFQAAVSAIYARMGAAVGSGSLFVLLPLSIVVSLLYLPLRLTMLLPVAGGVLVRRWASSPSFQRDMRPIPDAAPSVVEALLALHFGIAVVGMIGATAITAGSHVLGVYPAGGGGLVIPLLQSQYARACASQAAIGLPFRVPVAVPILAELCVRCASILKVVSEATICFAIMVGARSIPRGLAGVVGVALAEATLTTTGWWFMDFLFYRAFGFPGTDSPLGAAMLLLRDVVVGPAVAAVWACAGCWAITRLHDRIAGMLAAQETAAGD